MALGEVGRKHDFSYLPVLFLNVPIWAASCLFALGPFLPLFIHALVLRAPNPHYSSGPNYTPASSEKSSLPLQPFGSFVSSGSSFGASQSEVSLGMSLLQRPL